MTKLQVNLSKYLAILVGIVCTWTVTTLGHTPLFSALYAQPALVSLTILVVGWLGLCATHYVTTGDPAPVVPAQASATTPAMTGILARLAAVLERLAAKLDPPAPGPAPTPPPAPRVQPFVPYITSALLR